MGMILGPIYIAYIVIAIFIYKKLAGASAPISTKIIVLAILILPPTYDIILTQIFRGYYCLTSPKTFVKEKIEYPESIYWEDNVYPGYNEKDRKLMIGSYLDGIHLKKIALNGDDGKVYI